MFDVLLVEPSPAAARRLHSELVLHTTAFFPPNRKEIQRRLKELRTETVSRLDKLVRQLTDTLASTGADVVTACSTCALALKQEIPRFVGTQEAETVSRRTYDILEYLVLLEARGVLDEDFQPMDLRLLYHAPCHLKALGREGVQNRIRLLRRIPGLVVEEIDRGCCGMAGVSGLKASNYERSFEIGRPLFEAIRQAAPDRVATDCFACKLQIEEGTGLAVTHPILVLEEAYRRTV